MSGAGLPLRSILMDWHLGQMEFRTFLDQVRLSGSLYLHQVHWPFSPNSRPGM